MAIATNISLANVEYSTMTSLTTLLERSRNILLHQQYIPTDYYILDDQKLVYISIPKVACTSIKIATMGSENPEGIREDHMNIHSLAKAHHQHQLRYKHRNYYKFTFVRNPFDRLVSCYEDKVRKPYQHNGRYYFDTGYNSKLIKSLFGSRFHADMNFNEFIRLVSKIPDFISDGHFKSQYATLFRHGKRIPDYIGHFERLVEDWEPLARRFGLPPLGQMNPSTRDDWKKYYINPQTVELVAKRFRKDINEFEYDGIYHELLKLANS